MYQYSNSKVTLELRDVLASFDENGKPFDLWDFEYPSYYQGEAKAAFEQKVIDHYLFHQIGVETIARFKHNFKTRLREIMPYYIQYYKSVEIMDKVDDPFGNVDITETFEQTTTGSMTGTTSNTETGTTSSTNTETGTASNTTTETGTASDTETTTKTDDKTASENREHRFSNTPQGDIDNISAYLTEASRDNNSQTEKIQTSGTVKTDKENELSVTGESDSESTATATGESSVTSNGSTESENTGTVSHTLTRKGNQGVNTYAHDMIEYRQSFINVDMMVIGALRDLFLLIY